jgi:hypothetical protein
VTEVIFVVVQAPEGGFVARALREALFLQSDTVFQLHAHVRDAVRCHFDEGNDLQTPAAFRARRGLTAHSMLTAPRLPNFAKVVSLVP